MNISRPHIIMLAAISVFTGMIAPAASNAGLIRPYAMTNMQYVAFVILLWLAGLFLCVNLNAKKTTNFLIGTLIVLIISLFVMTITGFVKSFTGVTLQTLWWWWIFLIIGLFFLFVSLIGKFQENHNELTLVYERILGFIWAGVLLVMSIFVITIAKISSDNIPTTATPIANMFGKKTESLSGVFMTPSFDNISLLDADRTNNSLSFIATSSGQSLWYPAKIEISEPTTISKILSLNNENYILTQSGNIIKNNEIIGTIDAPDEKNNFLFYKDKNGIYQFISPNFSTHFEVEWENIAKIFFDEKNGNIYWRADVNWWQILYKNGKAITDIYPNILRYVINQNDGITMVVEDFDNNKMVIKDWITIHTINENYVRGTLQMNGNDVIYAIHNTDDDSFSLVVNGSILDRRLAEIREVFLEKNTNGYAYFGRTQNDNTYCLFTRYRWNLCNFTAYMNPQIGADGADIIFAWNRNGIWTIYKNTDEFITGTNYGGKVDISHDFFFFDITNPRHFIFVEKWPNSYTINKSWTRLPQSWKDINVDTIYFHYDGKVILSVQDDKWWHIAEI